MPRKPIRVWIKNTGPLESSLIRIAKIGISQLKTRVVKSKEITRSKTRFPKM
jgi:hypothetical protein